MLHEPTLALLQQNNVKKIAIWEGVMKFPQVPSDISSTYISFCPYRSLRSHPQTHSVQLMCLCTQPRRYHWVNQKPNNSTTSQNGKALQKVTEPFPVPWLPSAPPASTPTTCGSTGTRAGCYQGACEQDELK